MNKEILVRYRLELVIGVNMVCLNILPFGFRHESRTQLNTHGHGAYAHEVMTAILVFQNNETAAMLPIMWEISAFLK